MIREAIIVDIDGTIADCAHRRHFVETKPKDWKNFRYNAPYDTPVKSVIRLVNIIHDSNQIEIILCSGRTEDMRELTVDWLKTHEVKYHYLHMRKNLDYRDDTIVKKEILDDILASGFEIVFSIDDRKKVVNMWRKNGILTLQCADGDF